MKPARDVCFRLVAVMVLDLVNAQSAIVDWCLLRIWVVNSPAFRQVNGALEFKDRSSAVLASMGMVTLV